MDFVIIATLRPQILEVTLRSFSQLFNQFPDRRLILNVDPVGDVGVSQQDIVEMCRLYFPVVIERTPSRGNFSAAVFWAWQQVESEIFFHLEDDWCLRRFVDFAFVEKLLSHQAVTGVRLNIGCNSSVGNSGFVESDGLSLNPSFFRKSLIEKLLTNFDVTLDPEKQFRPLPSDINQKLFIYYGGGGDAPLVIDTGKKWRKSHGFRKWSSGEEVVWVGTNAINYFRLFKFKIFLRYWIARYC